MEELLIKSFITIIHFKILFWAILFLKTNYKTVKNNPKVLYQSEILLDLLYSSEYVFLFILYKIHFVNILIIFSCFKLYRKACCLFS